MGKVAELEKWGATLTNTRWGWDGVKADGSVLFIGWEDNTVRDAEGGFLSCSIFTDGHQANQRPGGRERARHIAQVMADECVAYLLIATARDIHQRPRTIARFDPVEYSVRLVRQGGFIVAEPVGLRTTPEPTVSEAEEITRDLAALGADLPETERRQLSNARLGQGLFRRRLEFIEPGCRVTGTTDRAHLRASHIKPWRVSSNAERLDGHNGLLLAPHVDHLFDRGFISFGSEGELLISPQLTEGQFQEWFFDRRLAARPLSAAQRGYLEYHRAEIFRA